LSFDFFICVKFLLHATLHGWHFEKEQLIEITRLLYTCSFDLEIKRKKILIEETGEWYSKYKEQKKITSLMFYP
jgi:predicted nuclease of restriction endonuclease-like RecB superfamily